MHKYKKEAYGDTKGKNRAVRALVTAVFHIYTLAIMALLKNLPTMVSPLGKQELDKILHKFYVFTVNLEITQRLRG